MYSWRILRTFLLVWLFAAVAIARFGLLAGTSPVPQMILVFMTATLSYCVWKIAAIRDPLWNCDIRVLIGIHVTRFVGLWLLELYNEGRLPYEFGVRGGVGDIAVATLALIVLIIPSAAGFRRTAIQVWNAIGLLDILMVVVTAIRLNVGNPHSLDELRALPLSLLPTFLVPIIIVSHAIIWLRARSDATIDINSSADAS